MEKKLQEMTNEELVALQKEVKAEAKARKAGKLKEGFNKIKSSKITKAVAGAGAIALLGVGAKKVLSKDKSTVETIPDNTHVVSEE